MQTKQNKRKSTKTMWH